VAVATFAAGLAAGDTVRLRSGLRFRLTADGDRAVLALPERTITLPRVTEQALHALLDPHPSTVGDLPGLDGPDQLVLVRRLLREGVVVPAARG
jgi:bifunctional lysine-specific demethylase and histidyl-hydroxylase NO66